MKILAVDTNTEDLKQITLMLSALFPNEEILNFPHPVMAVKYGAGHPVDLLVTAIDMPACTGPLVYQRLLKYNNGLSVIFLTSQTEKIRPGCRRGKLLEKPVTQEALANAIQQLSR